VLQGLQQGVKFNLKTIVRLRLFGSKKLHLSKGNHRTGEDPEPKMWLHETEPSGFIDFVDVYEHQG
jgi:hypothetical protein